MEKVNKTCVRCGATFQGTINARNCLKCRKRISSEGAKKRKLWNYGADGRWNKNKKPEWVGPSAELLQEDT